MQTRRVLLAWALLTQAACVPDLDSDESTLVAPRVLAIRAEPAEAAAGGSVRYSALVADGTGVRSDLPLSWFHCNAQKPLAELGPIDRDCLYAERGALTPLGNGQEVAATLPSDACALFGPNPPLPMADTPPGRPVDADESGGYKLPVIAGLSAGASTSAVLYEQRISCGLAQVAPEIGFAYAQRYHANENPRVSALRALRASGPVELSPGQPLELTVGERVELELEWHDCPIVDSCGDAVCGADESRLSCAQDCEPARGCGGAERYVLFDRERGELTVRREAMRVAWYATSGTYDEERTGTAEDAVTRVSRNGFVAPSQPGAVTLIVVLRDARGGVGTLVVPVTVR